MRIVNAFLFLCLTVGATHAVDPTLGPNDWPFWRGPHRNGHAPATADPPTSWSPTENIVWRTAVPGRGHGSPTMLGDQIFLAVGDNAREVQSVLCFDRKTGKREWEAIIHEGGFANKSKRGLNEKATMASSTVATDGTHLFITFVNDSAAWATALDRSGNQVWQKRLCDYVIHQGYGSSPTVYGDLVIVSADTKAGGIIAGLNRETGEFAWSRKRPKKPNYHSPVILRAADREQLIAVGCDLVTSLDPATGELLWEVEGATTECVATAVTDGQRIFTSGGYPKNHISAVMADGSGKVSWENNSRNYVPSMLVRDGYLYATLDAGIAICYRSSDGVEMWKARLGGTFSSSPVLVGDRIYASNEEGRTFVFKAIPDKFEQIAVNQLGNSVFATPTFSGKRIFARVAERTGEQRQEFLVCIGE
ncbi:MAG: PQQ-binding-like beta-propeller repeat protein [Planctomycetota bacterium]